MWGVDGVHSIIEAIGLNGLTEKDVISLVTFTGSKLTHVIAVLSVCIHLFMFPCNASLYSPAVQALKSQYNSLRTPRQLMGGLVLYFALVNSWGFLHHAFSMAPNLSNPTIMLKVNEWRRWELEIYME